MISLYFPTDNSQHKKSHFSTPVGVDLQETSVFKDLLSVRAKLITLEREKNQDKYLNQWTLFEYVQRSPVSTSDICPSSDWEENGFCLEGEENQSYDGRFNLCSNSLMSSLENGEFDTSDESVTSRQSPSPGMCIEGTSFKERPSRL